MNRHLDGKRIQPVDLTPDVYAEASIVENMVLASSNHLRTCLELQKDELLSGLIPKFVTRRNPSLDNYFADLLLRTCYMPVDYLPGYEEHVIRGYQKELPSEFNPSLVDSVLIGIGGMSGNPDFNRVYDEHDDHGTRRAKSASQVIFQEHLEHLKHLKDDHPHMQSLRQILLEINNVDSQGGASYDHLSSVVRNLHIAQFLKPGFVVECLEAQWKRAIIGAILMSVCVSVDAFKHYDNLKAIQVLEHEWNLYFEKSEHLRESGLLEGIEPTVVEYVKSMIHRPYMLEIRGKPSFFTHRRILFALQRVWHPQVVSFIMGFLFEAMLQVQKGFEEMIKRPVSFHSLPGSYVFIYYQKEPKDKLPHRGLVARMNNEQKRAIVVIHDSFHQITAVFRNKHLPYHVWKRFYDCLIEKEGDRVWYTPTQEDGKIANFLLNGTESFTGVPMTNLTDQVLFELFSRAVDSR